jgi:PAS domain S-box-containing protein
MPLNDGWSGLFETAFRQSRNAMVLVDDQRRQLDANGAYLRLLGHHREAIIGQPIYRFVAGGPLASPDQWAAALAAGRFTGEAELVCADGSGVAVQWAASTEVVTGRRLVLFVALTTSRWGRHFRRLDAPEPEAGTLSPRECEVVRLVAHGSAGPEIADELGIAHETVRSHVRNAMDKLGARSRAHLVAKALGEGLVLSPPGFEPSASRTPLR